MLRIHLYCFIVILLFLQTFSFAKGIKHNNPTLTEYERNIITYFKEIALGFEFGNAPELTRKWTKTIKIFVDGSPNATLTNELQSIVNELNTLIIDNVEIEIVADPKVSNLHIFFGKSSDYGLLYPKDAAVAEASAGMYRLYWNPRNEITKGHIYIKMDNNSEEEQKHALREELTQSLGLGKDSELYTESIFLLRYSTVTQYATVDKEVIRLLYHPRMLPGLSASEVDNVLTEILSTERDKRISVSKL